MTSDELFDVTDGFAAGSMGPVCTVIWRQDVIRRRFERQRAALAHVVSKNPTGATMLCVIEPSADPPDSQLRGESMEMIASHVGILRCVALVVEGDGFRNAFIRSVLSGMLLMRRHSKVDVSIFADVDSATLRMEKHLPFADRQRYIASVETLRAALKVAA